MGFIEVRFNIEPMAPARDILIAELSEIGYDSFVEDEDGLKAYIEGNEFDNAKIRSLHVMQDHHFNISFDHGDMPDTNWNAEWEKNYEAIEIGDRIRVRASFHKPSDKFKYEVHIDPRMSFGTGHHSTTRLMLGHAVDMPLTEKDVLDMGCGTAVIAILAKMRGARTVLAIDIDENSVRNSQENIALNAVEIDVQKGGAECLKGLHFDVIFANINRNVLLEDMPHYVEALNSGGTLLMSGFYKQDIAAIKEKADSCGMEFLSKAQELDWCFLEFVKR